MTEEPVSSQEKESASLYLSETLDHLGYSERRRTARVAYADKWSTAKTISTREILKNVKIDKIFVGSECEGIALPYESDEDILQVNNEVICIDKDTVSVRSGCVIFQIIRENVPAGYALLRLCKEESRCNGYLNRINSALVDYNGQEYLSSEKYMQINEDVFHQHNGCIGRNTVYKTRKGPSIPKFVQNSPIIEIILKWLSVTLNQDMDFVRAFPCTCTDLLEKWCTRNRTMSCDWPSQETIQQVSKPQTYVVPVGETGSQTEPLQWRISFVQAEIQLVRSFNDTQAKVLILLRYIGRHLLSPICEDITSYIMKNVMFWLAEGYPQEMFQEQYLLDRLEDALKFLEKCVKEKRLANYMTPDRNLFHEKLRHDEQMAVLEKLSQITTNCTRFTLEVSRCKSLVSSYSNLNKLLFTISFCSAIDVVEIIITKHWKGQQFADFNSFHLQCSNHLTLIVYRIYKLLRNLTFYKYIVFPITEEDLQESGTHLPMTESASICLDSITTQASTTVSDGSHSKTSTPEYDSSNTTVALVPSQNIAKQNTASGAMTTKALCKQNGSSQYRQNQPQSIHQVFQESCQIQQQAELIDAETIVRQMAFSLFVSLPVTLLFLFNIITGKYGLKNVFLMCIVVLCMKLCITISRKYYPQTSKFLLFFVWLCVCLYVDNFLTTVIQMCS